MRHLFEPSPLGYTFYLPTRRDLQHVYLHGGWCSIIYGSTQCINFQTDAPHQYFSRELEGDRDLKSQRNGEEEVVPIRLCSTPANAFANSPLPLLVKHQTHAMQRSGALSPPNDSWPPSALSLIPPSSPSWYAHRTTPPPPPGVVRRLSVYPRRSLTALWFN